jgi:chromosome segregation ATPase
VTALARKEAPLAKPSVVAERRGEGGVQEAFALLDAATKTTRAECARLADERRRLTAEIDELRAARDEEQRKLTELQALSDVEFLRRCVAAGTDKHTIEELRAQLRSALTEIDETLSHNEKE